MAELNEYTAQLEREEEQKKFLLREIKKGASEEITNNPAFERTFDMFYSLMKQEVGSSYMTPEISEDGKTVTVTKEGVKKDDAIWGDRLKNNRAIGSLKYSIDEAGNLRVGFDSGEVYDAGEYARAIQDPTVSAGFERTANMHGAKSVLDTYYRTDIYNKHGVELSSGNFYDMGGQLASYAKDVVLSEQVLSKLHKPEFGYDDFRFPMFSTDKAEANVSFRPESSLGVISTKRVVGKNQMPTYEIYPSNTEWPERLAPSVPTPAATYSVEEKGYVVDQYNYPGINDFEELKEYLDNSFTMGIEGSKTKEYDGEQYEGILATMSQEEEKEQTK